MSTKFLSKTLNNELTKEYTDILNTVDINNEVSTKVCSLAVADKYKFVSEVISSVDFEPKDVRRKGMKAIMQESFFHGAGWMGNNFIA